MIIEMLIGVLNTLLATVFMSVNHAAPKHRPFIYDTNADHPETCIQKNENYITHVCTYPGQKLPCLHESFGINGTIKHVYDINRLAELLCNGNIDQRQIYDQYCCHSKKCWFWCYGNKVDGKKNVSIRNYRFLTHEYGA